MAFLESSGDPTAVSEDGAAKGLLQVTPTFHQQQKIQDIADIKEVANKAASYLRHAYNRMGQSPNTQAFEGFNWDLKWELAVMAYHAGVQGVLNWLGDAAPLTGDHKNVGEKTLNYGERIADYMMHGFDPEVMRPNWDKQAK
jgi:soluble lytic murein transglycosylase-like protein